MSKLDDILNESNFTPNTYYGRLAKDAIKEIFINQLGNYEKELIGSTALQERDYEATARNQLRKEILNKIGKL